MYGKVDYYGVPSAKRLGRLTQGLTGVRILDVAECPRFATAILAPTSAATLPQLVDLHLEGCFNSTKDFPHPFSPDIYVGIQTYASLCRLLVAVRRALLPRQLPSSFPRSKGNSIPSLGGNRSWAVRLEGPLGESTAALDLIASFKTIDALHLRNTAHSDSIDLDSVTYSIQTPHEVQELGLAQTFASNNSNGQDLVAHLQRLKRITFGGAVFRVSLLPTLATLTDLREVVFSVDADHVTDAGLSAMLDGPDRLSQIHTVHIDLSYPPDDIDWRHPFTLNGTIANLKRAEKHGIQLEGSIVDMARRVMEAPVTNRDKRLQARRLANRIAIARGQR